VVFRRVQPAPEPSAEQRGATPPRPAPPAGRGPPRWPLPGLGSHPCLVSGPLPARPGSGLWPAAPDL